MSWFRTALSIAEVGLEIGQYQQLQSIKDQQAATLYSQLNESARKAFIEAAKHELFNIKQFADQALLISDSNPNEAAGAFRYLGTRLQENGITPSLFPDIHDKEYCAEVTSLVQNNALSLTGRLGSDERAEVDRVAKAMFLLPDLKFYSETYNDVQTYRQTKPLADNKRKKKKYGGLSAKFQYGSSLGKYMNYFVLAIFGITPLMMWNSSGFGSSLIFAIIIWGLGFVLWRVLSKQKDEYEEFQEARRQVKELEEKIDIDYFEALEQRFGANLGQIQSQLQESQQLVDNFFTLLNPKILAG